MQAPREQGNLAKQSDKGVLPAPSHGWPAVQKTRLEQLYLKEQAGRRDDQVCCAFCMKAGGWVVSAARGGGYVREGRG